MQAGEPWSPALVRRRLAMREISFQQLFEWGMSRRIPPIVSFPEGPIINLGAGRKVLPFPTIDLDLPEWDAQRDPIPALSGTVAGAVAFHFLEHLPGNVAIRVINETERVLKVGGSMLIAVPYYNSQLQSQNLDHLSSYCEETWRNLLDDPTYRRLYGRPSLRVGFNVICGIVERNMCLMTQLIKTEE